MDLEFIKIILDIGSVIISAIAIIIIIYNIIINERKLKKHIQSIYQNIENLIFTFYQNEYYEIEYKDKEETTEEIRKGKEEHTRLSFELKYFEKCISESSKDLHYLGLAFLDQSEGYVNKSLISMKENGCLTREG